MQIAISFRNAASLGTLAMRAVAIAALASAAVSAPSIAGQPGEVLVRATMGEWSSAVSRDLERNLTELVDPPMQHRPVPTGVVSVRFGLGDDGDPANIEVSQPSGSAALDSIGMRAVARLGSLPPLPAGVGKGQVFEANIAVAGDLREHERQLAALRQRDATRKAVGEDTQVLALNASFDVTARRE